ncbi:hypothetical protein FA15DRAFT_661566 [Coprinopsis marcescibilis]|uniref:Uncharacterized protein n=1 Tax=Coprinopsis marcescibilis TaxID=230819 RepID=A0A5C3KC96_COPMA|nr:hypothetical protein FA15DRAFT_661566 [Coprinopsis marcescibilis]
MKEPKVKFASNSRRESSHKSSKGQKSYILNSSSEDIIVASQKSKREKPSVTSSSRHSTPTFDDQNTSYDDSTAQEGEHLGSPHSFDSTEKQVKEATAGDLFVAVSGNQKAFWVMYSDNKWHNISEKEAHPTLSNHQLRISQGNPSWVTNKTGHTYEYKGI